MLVLAPEPALCPVGHYKGEFFGACTDCRRFWAQHRAGNIDASETELISGRLCPSVGTCNVTGTASTMACLIEALGLSLPMSATAPQPTPTGRHIAEASGKRAAKWPSPAARSSGISSPTPPSATP